MKVFEEKDFLDWVNQVSDDKKFSYIGRNMADSSRCYFAEFFASKGFEWGFVSFEGPCLFQDSETTAAKVVAKVKTDISDSGIENFIDNADFSATGADLKRAVKLIVSKR